MKRTKFCHTISWALILFLIVIAFYFVIPSFQLPVYTILRISDTPGDPFDDMRYTPVFNDEEDVLIQPFVLTSPFLESVKIRLTYHGMEAAYDWILNLRLVSPSGRVVREHNLTIGEFGDYGHYTFDINRLLRPGAEYRLEMRQITYSGNDPVPTQSFSVLLKPDAPTESLTPTFNGAPVDGALDIIYAYLHLDPLSIILFACILISVFVYFKFPALRFAVLALLAPLATFILTERLAGNLATLDRTAVIANVLLHYFFFFFFFFLTGKFRPSALLYSALMVFIALAQYFILEFRGKPIILADIHSLSTALSVAGSYTYRLSPNAIFCLLSWLGYMIYLFMHPAPASKPFTIKNAVFRLAGIALMVAISITGILTEKDLSRLDLWWASTSTFRKSGLLFMPYLETGYFFPSAPEGYSAQRIEQIAQRAPSASVEEGIVPENLIVIMNETLADLNCIAPVRTDKPLLPYLSSGIENTISGWLHMPVFGSGTSTCEYEVLSGNSNLFLIPGSSAYYVYVSPPEYGMVMTLKQLGYSRIALHPEKRSNWNRDIAYPMMEFEEFYSLENWGVPTIENIRNYASDASSYQKLMKLTEEKQPGEKLFLFLVTMQNHGGYDPMPSYTPDIELQYDTHYPKAQNYLSLINESDKAYRELIEYYSRVEEPTMIVMFGDHQPKIEDEFYEELYGKPLENLTKLENQKRFMTPYIIWANYPLDTASGMDMSSNYFGSFILQTANMPLTPYDRFLLNMKDQIPVLGQGIICDASGTWHSMENMPKAYQNLFNDYRILQYNRVFDRSHLLHHIFLPENIPAS